jgi:hypothetical protein
MTTAVDHPSPCDAAPLAASVRSLAAQAHHTLNDPAGDGHDHQDLARQVDDLRRCLGDDPSSELARWLEDLGRRIEAHGAAA